MKKYLAVFLVSCLSTACSNEAYFEENKPINKRSWEYSQIPAFEVHIDDKNAKYDVFINLRHSNKYDYSNIYLLLHTNGKGLPDTAYRHEIKLAELDGKWVGKSSGSLYQIQQLAKQDFSFPDTGKYLFRIEQNMRVNPLLDVSDVGIKIMKK